MSDSNPDSTETQVEKKKTPLELVKERKAAMNQNRGIKGAKSGSEKTGGVAEAPSSKPMRSSASKQGG